jgi:stage III sporulation protein AG
MKSLWGKIKKIKNYEIYIAVIIIVIIIAIYFSSLNTEQKQTADNTQTTNNFTNTYADDLEKKLTNIIGSIKNSGSVTVMVMTDGDGTNEIAYDYDEKTVTQTGSSGQSTSTTTINKKPLLGSGGVPIILYKTTPEIIGVVIVATGAYDVGVKMAILLTVQTILGNSGAKVEILTGK